MKKILKDSLNHPVQKEMRDQFISKRKKLFHCPQCEKRFKILVFTATLAMLFIVLGPKYRSQHQQFANPSEFIALELAMASELDSDLLDAAITDIDLDDFLDDTSIN
jgi:hypothetical protein